MIPSAIETAASNPIDQDEASSVVPDGDSDLLGHVPPGGVWAGELYFQRCRWCHTAVFRRLLCPACASPDLAWERSDGTGAIRHISVVGRCTGRPRAIAIIEMAEGFRLRSRIIGTPPDTVRVGACVQLASGIESGARELLFRLCTASCGDKVPAVTFAREDRPHDR